MSPYWLIAVLVAIFGAAIYGRTRVGRPPNTGESRRQAPEPLKPGEDYDNSVKLATVPNVPLADLWRQRLREEGIPALYRSGAATPALVGDGGPGLNPAFPVEIWVGEHDVERARELFPELA